VAMITYMITELL